MSSAEAGTDTTLRMSRRFAAPRERVFRAWTEPAQLERWWGPPPFSTVLAELDPVPGGRFRLGIQKTGSPPLFVTGTYREVVAPSRLVFTWRWEDSHEGSPETLVTLEFVDAGGETELRLTHELFLTADDREEHRWGWTGCFDKLPRVL